MKLNKLFAGVLAAAMMMSIGVSAMATTSSWESFKNVAPVVTKDYKSNNGTAPADTFTFEFEQVSYQSFDADTATAYAQLDDTQKAKFPNIADVEIEYEAGIADTAQQAAFRKTVNATVNANNYNLGYYVYKVTETVGNTAGITYTTTPQYLKLTILREDNSTQYYIAAMHYETLTGTKNGVFTNTYDSGKLTVTKEIKGNQANMDETFEIQVVLTAPEGKTVKSDIGVSVNGGSAETRKFDTDGTLTVTGTLGNGQTIVIDNLPAGVTYEVTEPTPGDYISTITYTKTADNADDKTINANDTDTVTVTNTRGTDSPDTGVILDNAPYILMLAVVAGGVFFMVAKKRREE